MLYISVISNSVTGKKGWEVYNNSYFIIKKHKYNLHSELNVSGK
jgi:hypothetical protein